MQDRFALVKTVDRLKPYWVVLERLSTCDGARFRIADCPFDSEERARSAIAHWLKGKEGPPDGS